MRKIFTFHGGIHPPENKNQSVCRPIADAGVPPELVIPLSQHIGAPAAPIVAVGDHVLKGQPIAEPKGFVSVPKHAPSSGTVVAIENRQVAHPSGHAAPCIVIATDGKDEWVEHSGHPDYEQLQRPALLELIRQAGIAGMGGAGFPSAVKLSIRPDTRIETLIINGTECEPYITADDMLMRERAAGIIEGAKILRYLIQPGETLIGVEDNKPEGIAALRAAAGDSGIEVVEFPTKYPSGGEKQLIEILTGKQVPSGGLPADIGVVCQNLGSAYAVYEAVVRGRPLISRVTTVTGNAVREPQNFLALIGTPVRYLLERAGYQPEKSNRLIMGGPMMGFTLPDDGVPTVKTTNCLIAATKEELPAPPPAQACIRCGMCAEACPVSLLPQQMFWFAQGKEFEKLEEHNLFDCIECGACSYVCPSNIPLVQYYRASKAEILQLRRTHAKAEHSRMRFEARQFRLEQADADKVAQRAARREAAERRAREGAAADTDGGVDPVQAAIQRAQAKKAAQQESNAGQQDERETLEKAVVSATTRLSTALAKLEQAQAEGSDLVPALQTGVDKTREKLAAAEQALRDYQATQAAARGKPGADDPAQAAIARAMAARAAEASLSPREKAQTALDKLEQRLATATLKLEETRAAGEEDKVIDALESTVARLGEKVQEARRQLQEMERA